MLCLETDYAVLHIIKGLLNQNIEFGENTDNTRKEFHMVY